MKVKFGTDIGTPVTHEYKQGAFTGKIERVMIDLFGEGRHIGPGAEVRAVMKSE